MAIVRGAFNELLRPGLKKVWDDSVKASRVQPYSLGHRISSQMLADDLYRYSERRTGVCEALIGRARRGIQRKPLSEVEGYPPRDWP